MNNKNNILDASPYLPIEMKLKVISNLSNKDLAATALIDKEFNEVTKLAWESKLKSDFDYDYAATSNTTPKLIYEMLEREHELFLAILKYNKYVEYITSLNDDWDYDHIPISRILEYRGSDALVREDIVLWQLTSISTESLLLQINENIAEIKENIIKASKANNVSCDMDKLKAKITTEAENVCKLLCNSPIKLKPKILKFHLALLCSINAHEMIRQFCRKYPSLVDFPFLLAKALNGLSLETLGVLIDSGADVNTNMLLYRDQDLGAAVYGSPLLCPLMALLLGPNIFLNLPNQPFVGCFRADHPKLLDILVYLLEHGANPLQEIYWLPWQADEFDFTHPELTIKGNFKDCIATLLTDPAIKYFSPDFLKFLAKASSFSPTTKFQRPRTTLNELNLFKKFLTDLTEQIEREKYETPSPG